MNKSKELIKTTELVKEILKNYTRARNSDNYLYYHVCSVIARQNGIDINRIPMPIFLLKLSDSPFPGFETVRRTRQKLQAKYPELAGTDGVEAQRTLNEEIFRNYTRKVTV